MIGEARQLDTYAIAKLKYPHLLEDIPIPEEREIEEDLGPVADDSPLEGAVDGNGVFDVQIGSVNQDTTELTEEIGPEEIEEEQEEIEEEKQIEQPKAKKARKKRAVQEEDGNVTTTKVSRTGRQVLPSTLHGTIVANRYSTMA